MGPCSKSYLTQLLFLDYWNLGMARVDGAISVRDMKMIHPSGKNNGLGVTFILLSDYELQKVRAVGASCTSIKW